MIRTASIECVERKKELRRQVLQLQDSFSAAQAASDSIRLCAHLRMQPLWQACRRVLAFMPMPAEPDIRPVLQEALAAGKRLALPRFDPRRRDYDVCEVSALTELRLSHFQIQEPGPDCPKADLFRLDFVLVPAVAYDANGRRLGRGKGYFDRLLAQVTGHKCGVAFDWQVVPEVPVQPHDVSVDSLLTPAGWLWCRAGRTVL